MEFVCKESGLHTCRIVCTEIAKRIRLHSQKLIFRLEEHEAIKLRGLLEERKAEAFNLGDFALAMGIIFLLAGLIGYLAEKFHLY